MSFEQKCVYLCSPATERGKKIMIHGDPKGKNFLYCRGKYIVVRDIKNPLEGYLYTEHSCKTTCAKYAPSGNYIASCDEKGIVRIWDTLGEEHMLKYEYPNALRGAIADVCWTEDSKRLAVCGVGADEFARAFLWDSGSTVGALTGHSKQVNALDIKQQRPYRLATAGEDTEVGFYANVPFKRQAMLKEHGKFVNCVRFAPDGSVFVTADAGGKAFVYDGKEGTLKGELNGGEASAHKGGIYGISWLPDSKQLLTCSADKSCKLWDVEANKLVATFQFPNTVDNMQVGCLAQGDHLISVSLNGYINYLDPANPDKPKRVVRGHATNISALSVSDGVMYSGSSEGRVCAWKVGSAEPEVVEGAHKSEVTSMAVVDGHVYSVGNDDTFFKTPVGQPKCGAGVKLSSTPTGLAVAAGGVAVVSSLKHIAVVKDGKKVGEVETDFEAHGVSVSLSGVVAVGGSDKKVHLYTLEDGGTLSPKGTLEIAEPVLCVAYSPDGKWLAAGDAKRQVYGWDVASGELKFDRWKYHDAKITSLAWAPDSLHLASGSLDTNIFVWNVEKPMSKIKIVSAHPSGMVTALQWTGPSTLYSAGYDSCIRNWEFKF